VVVVVRGGCAPPPSPLNHPSTESGLPDYRGPEGSYSKGHKPTLYRDFVSSSSVRSLSSTPLPPRGSFDGSRPRGLSLPLAAAADGADGGGGWLIVGGGGCRQRYWARNMLGWEAFSRVQPNQAHRALALMEREGVFHNLVTQARALFFYVRGGGCHQHAPTQQRKRY
jgi:hypothetical protein